MQDNGSVGGQADDGSGRHDSRYDCCRSSASVIGSAVTAGRTYPDGDARQARDRLDDPHELRWAKDAVVFAKPRREIGDAD